ncbi:hypothetical protein DXN04_24295 [Chitinophaga silvisoli]|uniref:Uncharacterized protein n=1 Tax=Chitinophaga silvisoli TaxID=2291814 RepID=A0A3E1NXY5_9BACT|nr:hypothetical protein DXN04_24295 [Chitinophaga silvisoli]
MWDVSAMPGTGVIMNVLSVRLNTVKAKDAYKKASQKQYHFYQPFRSAIFTCMRDGRIIKPGCVDYGIKNLYCHPYIRTNGV